MTLIERVKATITAVFTSKGHAQHQDTSEPIPVGPPDECAVGTASASERSEELCGEAPPSPESMVLSVTQRTKLEQIERSATSAQRLVTRSRILLAYGQGVPKNQISRTLNLDRKVVRKWCHRWEQARDLLVDVESRGISETAYRVVIAEALNDAFRSGAPVTFSAEAVTQIVAMACEVLDSSDEAVSHWTQRHLAEEAVRRGIVAQISRSSVGRFLREVVLKPHQDRYWLNAPEKDTAEFRGEVQTVCELYDQAPALHAQGIHVCSTDEKPGIQALDRTSPTHAAAPGGERSRELREHS